MSTMSPTFGAPESCTILALEATVARLVPGMNSSESAESVAAGPFSECGNRLRHDVRLDRFAEEVGDVDGRRFEHLRHADQIIQSVGPVLPPDRRNFVGRGCAGEIPREGIDDGYADLGLRRRCRRRLATVAPDRQVEINYCEAER